MSPNIHNTLILMTSATSLMVAGLWVSVGYSQLKRMKDINLSSRNKVIKLLVDAVALSIITGAMTLLIFAVFSSYVDSQPMVGTPCQK